MSETTKVAENAGLVPVAEPTALDGYNPFSGAMRYWANWQLTSKPDKARLMKAFQQADLKADDILGKPISVTHVLVHPVEIVDEETGEVTPCHRTVFVLDDGRTVGFVSAGILKSLGLICAMEGTGPWPGGITLMVRQITVKRARRMYVIDLIESPAAPAAKGKK